LSTWIHGGPGLFWLLELDAKKVISWLRAEEANEDIDANAKASAVLLRRKLGEMPLAEKDYQAFRGYQLSAELTNLIVEAALTLPIKLLLFGLRHRREEVREACMLSITERSRQGNWDWVKLLRNSSSVALQDAYDEIVLRSEIPVPEISIESDKSIKEFRLLKLLVEATSPEKAKKIFIKFCDLRPRKRMILLAQSLISMKQGGVRQLINRLKTASNEKVSTILKAPRCNPSKNVVNELLKTYQQWNAGESSRYNKTSLNAKTAALSSTIYNIMASCFLPLVRKCFKKIRLTSSSREIVLALLRFGNASDVKLVLDRVAKEKDQIDYWNHTELGKAASRAMQRHAIGIPPFLKEVITKKEFKEYFYQGEREQMKAQDLLPLKDISNRALYLRVAAYSAIGAATSEDANYLLELANHQYALIARAAAAKLVRLFGIHAFRMLSEKIDDAIQKGASSFSDALRYAEMEFYGIVDLFG